MTKIAKRIKAWNVDADKAYALPEAVATVKSNAKAKFDETVEVSVNLGVDPRHADQQVRGVVNLPSGTGRDVRVAVFAKDAKAAEATAAGADFAFMADALRAARFRVEAWNPSQAPRPAARNAQRRAWVVLPPLDRRSLEPDAAEQALLQATHRLIEEGESVLVLTTPSVSATLGMTDPWSDVLRACGVTARTDAMVVQLLARSESARELRNSLDDVLPAPGPLGHMIRGRVQWPLPMPLRIDSAMGWRASAVALVPPTGEPAGSLRSLSKNWESVIPLSSGLTTSMK
jgi:hypothetical protein